LKDVTFKERSMWKFAAELSPLGYAAAGLVGLASVWIVRKAREIWFVLVVAATVPSVLGSGRRRRGSLVIRIGDVGTLSFQPKRAR
jgi:hypothetical protein